MNESMLWILIAGFALTLYFLHVLAGQVERCLRLAFEIITAQQKEVTDRIARLEQAVRALAEKPSIERRQVDRRGHDRAPGATECAFERRINPGRRSDDRLRLATRMSA